MKKRVVLADGMNFGAGKTRGAIGLVKNVYSRHAEMMLWSAPGSRRWRNKMPKPNVELLGKLEVTSGRFLMGEGGNSGLRKQLEAGG